MLTVSLLTLEGRLRGLPPEGGHFLRLGSPHFCLRCFRARPEQRVHLPCGNCARRGEGL